MQTLKTCLAALCVGGLTLTLTMAQETPDAVQQVKSFKAKITTTVSADYLLFLPRDYNAKKSRRWPLILFLHGAGERGTNLWLVAKHGPPKIVRTKPEFPFIVVSPQCPAGQRWDNATLLGLLDVVIKKYRVDKSRIYLTGLSMGGFGTWNLGVSYPEKFAAIAPICGGGQPSRARALKKVPIWAFHGAKDETVPPRATEDMVEAVRAAGGNVRLTVYPEAGHDSWTETYANPELYTWLLSHTREKG
jgi:predicted peptidase